MPSFWLCTGPWYGAPTMGVADDGAVTARPAALSDIGIEFDRAMRGPGRGRAGQSDRSCRSLDAFINDKVLKRDRKPPRISFRAKFSSGLANFEAGRRCIRGSGQIGQERMNADDAAFARNPRIPGRCGNDADAEKKWQEVGENVIPGSPLVPKRASPRTWNALRRGSLKEVDVHLTKIGD